MKTYLTREMVMERYRLSADELDRLLSKGQTETATLNGTPIIADDDIRAYLAQRDVSREQFAHMDGEPILLSDAAAKYGFHIGSLAQWVESGHIRIVSTDGYRVFLNEADCAYARALADIKGTRSGRPLFGRRKRE